jgi:hypothetical protein
MTTFVYTFRERGGKLVGVARVTYPDGAVCCVAGATREFENRGWCNGRTHIEAQVAAQKNYRPSKQIQSYEGTPT